MKNSHPKLLILGRGSAGRAIATAAKILGWPEPHFLERGASLRQEFEREKSNSDRQNPSPLFLAIANPHGLHARTLIEADPLGFDAIALEKPACVSREEIKTLASIKTPVTVLHGYRMMWGPQMLRQLVTNRTLGKVFGIEVRYWQSSAADRALRAEQPLQADTPSRSSPTKSWKTDPSLSGNGDVILDLAPHVLDLAALLMGELPLRVNAWKSFAGADAPQRDTHVQMTAEFNRDRRGLFSISKIVHGATNQLEISVMGTLGTAHWTFENPDRIVLGKGKNLEIRARESREHGAGFPVYHGLGWIEGYVEILKQMEGSLSSKERADYPNLRDNLKMLELLVS